MYMYVNCMYIVHTILCMYIVIHTILRMYFSYCLLEKVSRQYSIYTILLIFYESRHGLCIIYDPFKIGFNSWIYNERKRIRKRRSLILSMKET